jgi:hypothetical protein
MVRLRRSNLAWIACLTWAACGTSSRAPADVVATTDEVDVVLVAELPAASTTTQRLTHQAELAAAGAAAAAALPALDADLAAMAPPQACGNATVDRHVVSVRRSYCRMAVSACDIAEAECARGGEQCADLTNICHQAISECVGEVPVVEAA